MTLTYQNPMPIKNIGDPLVLRPSNGTCYCYPTAASDGFKPVLVSTNAKISGSGHNSVTNSPDGSELFIVYHIHTDPGHPSGDRQVCIDRMGFREDGSLYVTGPTHTPQPIPSSKE